MKKFLALLSTAAIALTSLATVASAAITEDIFKPEWNVKVEYVEEGYAVIGVTIDVDTELALAKSGAKYTGQAIVATDLLLDFNTEIFDSSDISGDALFGTMDYNAVEDNYYASFLWNNDVNLVKQGTTIDHGDFWALLNPEYADMTAEELNKLDFATIVKAGLQIGDWQKVSGNKAEVASFYSDGTAAFDCGAVVGTPAEEPPYEPTWKAASSEWTAPEGKKAIWWPVDYAAGEFPGFVTVKVTDGTTTKSVGVGAANGFDIEGAVSFAVAAILDADVDATYFDCVVE